MSAQADYRDQSEIRELIENGNEFDVVVEPYNEGLFTNGYFVQLHTKNGVVFTLCKQKRSDRPLRIRVFKTLDSCLETLRKFPQLKQATIKL